MRYSVDSSALIEAWQRVYPTDVFPQFWERMSAAAEEGIIVVAEEVHTELLKKDDEVLGWANRCPEMVIPIDDAVQEAVSQVLARHPRLVDNRRNRSAGDPWVIALAITHDLTVVTYERASGSLIRPKIPDVCEEMGVPCIDVVGLIRSEGWRF